MKKVTKLLSATLVFALSLTTLFNSSNVSTVAESGYTLNSTYFKDANFRAFLSAKVDTNKDKFLSSSEISKFNYMEIMDETNDQTAITDLSGIEYLTELQSVFIYNTLIESADFSKNNKLSSIIITSTPTIKTLALAPATTTAVIAQCTSLKKADFSKATNLDCLTLDYTQVRDLNLYNNNKIKNLDLTGTPLESVTFSSNSQIESFSTFDSQFKSIDLSYCKKLTDLKIQNKKDTVLLSSFKVNNNNIKSLGFNRTSISSINLNNYPNLTSLEIENAENLNDFIYSYKNSLNVLKLTNTKVRAIDISNFPNLTNLAFVSTPIKHIDLPSCKKLKVVDVRDTRAGKLVIGNGTELASLLRTRKCTLHEADDYEYFTWADYDAQKYFTYESNICIYNY